MDIMVEKLVVNSLVEPIIPKCAIKDYPEPVPTTAHP
jgi:hypothetical protein